MPVPILKHITFTGIDDSTEVTKLQAIQRMYPFVEFGVLLSRERTGSDPRFPSVSTIIALKDAGLNLSLHLCGSLAKEAVRGDFSGTNYMLGPYKDLFGRVQLNISPYKDNPDSLDFENPSWVKELIIQQKGPDDCGLFLRSLPRRGTSVLLDASGGKGIDTPIRILKGREKVGYAGGISHENVRKKLLKIKNSKDVGPFWMDMESGVRTDNRFDIFKVLAVLSEVGKAMFGDGYRPPYIKII